MPKAISVSSVDLWAQPQTAQMLLLDVGGTQEERIRMVPLLELEVARALLPTASRSEHQEQLLAVLGMLIFAASDAAFAVIREKELAAIKEARADPPGVWQDDLHLISLGDVTQ